MVATLTVQLTRYQPRRRRNFTERGSDMSKHLPARTVLAGAAVMVLAGCGAAGTASTPQVSTGVGKAANSSARAAASASGAGHGTGAGHGSGAGATSNSYVAPVSIPFPVAVGDTWVYQTTANVSGATGLTTDRIVSSGPAAAGYQVTMAQTVQVGGSAVSAEPVYVFYPSGKVGFPVPDANGISVQGSGVTWPDSAGLASGQAYHSVVRVGVNQAGVAADQNADVTVQGAGTVPVTVPAGTYLASLVNMTISTQVGGYSTTVVVKTWLAPNLGPVQSEVLTQAGGQTKLITTNRLLSFTKGPGPADGS
jgi:hypothetical protein